MNTVILTHVDFEQAGYIEDWLKMRSLSYTIVSLFDNKYRLPLLKPDDLLVIMGGPMSVNDIEVYPWITDELTYIQLAIKSGIKTIGFCLGAQLIAKALGEHIIGNCYKEIGFLPVMKVPEVEDMTLIKNFPNAFVSAHWHGETFNLPVGATRLFETTACKNQSFIYNETVIAFQFHPEFRVHDIITMVEKCGNELEESAPFIQSKADILNKAQIYCKKNNQMLADFLDQFVLSK